MEDFSSTGQLVTLGFVDSSIGAMAEGLALVDVEALVVKDMLSLKHSMGHCVDLALTNFRLSAFQDFNEASHDTFNTIYDYLLYLVVNEFN